ncbi:armadillo-type protein [Scleroderma citrinum]
MDPPDHRRVKRFKYQSYADSIREAHLPSALDSAPVDDGSSHFYASLQQWRQLSLSPAFVLFANRADPLSASMPLLLHNWTDIVDLWQLALDSADDEALRPLLDLLQKLAHDLRTTLSPVYASLLQSLLNFLPRPIAAPALTSLLATLSALFRYLLIPSIHLDLLQQTWSSFHSTLPDCSAEVQRAAAEVWASVLRRLKSSAREKAVLLMAMNLTGVEDATTWMLIFACKSIAQSLHTTSASLVAPLIDDYLASDSPDPLYTLLRRTLTSLTHHCNGPEGFSTVAEAITSRFGSTVTRSPQDIERIRRMLLLVSVVCSVRRGSRLSGPQLSQLASTLESIPILPSIEPALLTFSSSLLIAGDTPLATGPGRTFILRALDVAPMFGVSLIGVLADLGWTGWTSIAQPALLRATSTLLDHAPKQTLHLLARLVRMDRLARGSRGVDVVWRRVVSEWVSVQLTVWHRHLEGSDLEAKVEQLHGLLALSIHVERMHALLIDIVDRVIEGERSSERVEEWRSSYANHAWVLGACMRALPAHLVRSGDDQVKLDEHLVRWTKAIVERWSWSENALSGLAVLLQPSAPSQNHRVPFTELYPFLQSAVLSHSRVLRLSALQILSSRLVSSSTGEQDVLRRCLQGEEVSLDMSGARDRVLRIGRVGVAVRDSEPAAADLCGRWLIAQLKVNLRPLWSPAAEALSALAKRLGDPIWMLMLEELRYVASTQDKDLVLLPPWLKEKEGPVRDQDTWEDERSWRDGAAHKVRQVVDEWMDDALERNAIILEQKPLDRFDPSSYEIQLLGALGQCASLAEKHNREIVPLFLTLADASSHDSMLLPRAMPYPIPLARPQLATWLTLFAKFVNPRALYASDTLLSIFCGLLAHPDRSLQSAALRCVLTYKSPELIRYEDGLWRLLDSTLWRDELTSIDFATVEPDVADVVVRLLYGVLRERKGRSRGGDGRRAAVLGALGACRPQELALLVDLMLAPLGRDSRTWTTGDVFRIEVVHVGVKQQIGFLNMLGDVLKTLGSKMMECWPALVGVTLSMVATAQVRSTTKIEMGTAVSDDGQVEAEHDVIDGAEEQEENDDDGAEVDVEDSNGTTAARSVRPIRQLGLRRLADFFRAPIVFDFTPFLPATFDAIIAPRLAVLDQENTQAPSALLEIFALWTTRPEYVHYLVRFDSRVLPKVLDCIVAPNVKPAVVNLVLDMVERLLALGAEDATVSETLVVPHLTMLLHHLTVLVERTQGDQVLATPLAQRQIGLLAQVAHYVVDGAQAETLVNLLAPLLRKPLRVVPERTKVDMLRVLGTLFPLIPGLADSSSAGFTKLYEVLSRLYLTFRTNIARTAISTAFNRLAATNADLLLVSPLLDSLNACSTKRINEPDFDRRLAAFATINDQQYETLTRRDWLPVLYNVLHFVQDPEELAIRSNAAFTLRRFIGVVVDASILDAQVLLLRVVLPALKGALRAKSELVRAEVLGVLAHAVSQCTSIPSLQEMTPLLAGGDEEASFFTNIYHIQTHRRTRALRRLGEHCDSGVLSSRTLIDVFVPAVEYYVAPTTTFDHLLVAEAISALGHIARRLRWSAYYSLVHKYLRGSKDKDDTVRVHVRALVSILENFHFSMDDSLQQTESAEDVEVEGEDLAEQPITPREREQEHDVKKVSDAVNMRLLPALLDYLSNRDENEDSLRIPIALGIVKIAMHLPAGPKETQITRLLTVLSQALRSRSQDTRDLVRETMCRIIATLGPSYLPYAVRELRAALLRGPQLHVLAYVVHAIMTYVTAPERKEGAFTDFDACVDDITHVASEVIFGESGKDVQSEDFKTKMREVKASASKGLDSFALAAKYLSPGCISALLRPLRSVMEVTTSAKPMQQVDEVLRRIAGGLNSNARLDPPELLVLCHTLISQNAKFLREAPPKSKPKGTAKKDDAIVQVKRKNVTQEDQYAHNSHRFVVFGLELFNTAFRRSRFDLHDNQILARLEPFVVLIGNTLYAESEAVLIAALKAAPAILRCPVKSASSSAPLISKQILTIIRSVGSAESEVAQTAFKSLATILRECPTSNIKENDLLFLLELLAPDLEDPSRQGSAFTLLRAIVSRKLVVPELYDLMTTVSSILITSQSAHTRESARSLLLQFLLDYPQGSARLQTTLTFFARNLSFEHASGRLSVMELLHAVITKFDTNLLAKHSEMLFVALVLAIANDDQKACREAAANVVQALVKRLADEQQNAVVGHLHAWAVQTEKIRLRGVAVQVYGLFIEALQRGAAPHVDTILADTQAVAEAACTVFVDDEVEDMENPLDWQAAYHALQTLVKALHIYPELTTDYSKMKWTHVFALLLFPHAWVRSAACRLLGSLFAAQSSVPAADGNPLTYATMHGIADKLCTMLKSPNLEAPVALQIVKNLFFVGKWFIAHPQESHTTRTSDDEDGSEGNDNEAELEDRDGQGGDPLPWLFSKLSFQARSAHIARRNTATARATWSLGPLSVFRFFAAMVSHMDGQQLGQFLPHILTPVYRVIEEDMIRDTAIDELKTTATELVDLVQAKVGTTNFATAYNRIRQSALNVRQERRVARVTRAITNPEAAAKRKIARNATKKESRKRKNRAFADSRGRLKRRREE